MRADSGARRGFSAPPCFPFAFAAHDALSGLAGRTSSSSTASARRMSSSICSCVRAFGPCALDRRVRLGGFSCLASAKVAASSQHVEVRGCISTFFSIIVRAVAIAICDAKIMLACDRTDARRTAGCFPVRTPFSSMPRVIPAVNGLLTCCCPTHRPLTEQTKVLSPFSSTKGHEIPGQM